MILKTLLKTKHLKLKIMLQFINITGKKENKLTNEEVIIGSPTLGQFKVTPATANKLEIQDGDSIVVVQHPQDRNRVFIAKGITGVPDTDENGEVVVDKRNRVVFKDNSQFGALVSPAAKGSPMLSFAASTAWTNVGCDAEHNTVFTLSEGQEGEVPTNVLDEEGNEVTLSTVFYELILKEKKAKSRRGSSEDEDDEDIQDVEFEEGQEEEV